MTQTPSTAHTIEVLLGRETLLREAYPDEASAVRRADEIREGLLKGGGWTMTEILAPEMPTGAVNNAS